MQNIQELIPNFLQRAIESEIENAKETLILSGEWKNLLSLLEKRWNEYIFNQLSQEEFLEAISLSDDIPSISYLYWRLNVLNELLQYYWK